MKGIALSQEEVVASGFAYFDIQAHIGTTKHMGGLAATKELAALCHIDSDTYVLDIGCGVGATACYVAKTYGARVVGIDTHEAMVVQARERARREGVEGLVELRIADGHDLPFQDALLGAVIAESMISFVEEKQPLLHEAARVTRPAGYVGFNEEIWLKKPPRRLVEFTKRTWGMEPPYAGEWRNMLDEAGLGDIVVRRHKLSAWREASQLKRYRLSDLIRMGCRMLCLYVRQSTFRKYMAERRNVPKDLFDYLGYAVCAGRKWE